MLFRSVQYFFQSLQDNFCHSHFVFPGIITDTLIHRIFHPDTQHFLFYIFQLWSSYFCHICSYSSTSTLYFSHDKKSILIFCPSTIFFCSLRNPKCLQILFKNLTVYKSNLVNLIHCFGFFRQLLEFRQSNAIKLCPFLIAYKFLCYFLCFLYISTCISHTRHLLFCMKKAANLFFID